jgi:hypothetical protein
MVQKRLDTIVSVMTGCDPRRTQPHRGLLKKPMPQLTQVGFAETNLAAPVLAD